MKKVIFRIGLSIMIFMSILNLGLFTDSQVLGNGENGGNEEIIEEEVNINIPTYDDWYQSHVRYSRDYLDKIKIPREVKGLYLTGYSAGNSKFDHLVNLLNTTELNSMVIDVKEDVGYITYKSEVPQVKEVNSDRKTFIKDIDDVLQKAKENNIYTIARIVTFKDPFYAGAKPEYAMQKKLGGVWRDYKGISWIDPYRKEVWDYNIAIAKEAAEKGFKEIQFDYVRFPANGKKVNREVNFNNTDNFTKAEVIAEFLTYAKEELKDYPVFISADVFGMTTSVQDDMGIGQQWELLAPVVDYISPMMYPSHYGNGLYGLKVPDARPYETIKSGLEDAIEKNNKLSDLEENVAIIRPWYQDFTATWVKGYIQYGPDEVLAQIKAGNDLGVNEYIMWNATNTYSEEAWINK